MPLQDRFCCCIPLQAGTILIGLIEIVLCFLELYLFENTTSFYIGVGIFLFCATFLISGAIMVKNFKLKNNIFNIMFM